MDPRTLHITKHIGGSSALPHSMDQDIHLGRCFCVHSISSQPGTGPCPVCSLYSHSIPGFCGSQVPCHCSPLPCTTASITALTGLWPGVALYCCPHTAGLVSLTIREGCTRSTTPPYVYTIQENNLQKGASCWALLEAPGRPWDEPCYGRPSPGQTATDPHSGHSGGCASATGGGHPPGGGASLPISPVQQRAFSHRWLWWPHSHTTTLWCHCLSSAALVHYSGAWLGLSSLCVSLCDCNDPAAGSPTTTLLRLLLPLAVGYCSVSEAPGEPRVPFQRALPHSHR